MNRTTTLAVLAALVLAAPAIRAQELSEAEQAAMKEARSCFTRQLIDLDDSTSDARTIARAAIKSCPAEIDALGRLSGASVSEGTKLAFRKSFEDGVTDTVAGYVLQWRAVKRDLDQTAAGAR